MLNVRELRAAIVRKGLTQRQVAQKCGMSEKTFISRMKNGAFGTDEAQILIELLDIKNPVEIFFASDLT